MTKLDQERIPSHLPAVLHITEDVNGLRCDRTRDSSLISPISHLLIAVKWKVSEFHTELTIIFQPRGCDFSHPANTAKASKDPHPESLWVIIVGFYML